MVTPGIKLGEFTGMPIKESVSNESNISTSNDGKFEPSS
jgi:hypothetical protein